MSRIWQDSSDIIFVSLTSRAARRECVANIKVAWLAEGQRYKQSAEIQDRSKGGLGLALKTAIPVETILAITQGSSTSFGIVRHCTKLRGKYFLGIELCEIEAAPTVPNEHFTPLPAIERREEERPKAASQPAPHHLPHQPSERKDEEVPRRVPLKDRRSARTDLVMLEPPPDRF